MYRHTRSLFFATTAIASALLFAAPALAQRGQGQGQGQGQGNGRGQSEQRERQRPPAQGAQAQRPPAQGAQGQRPPAQGQQVQRPQTQRPATARPQVQAPPARQQGPGVNRGVYQQPNYGPPYNNGNGRGNGWGRGGYGPTYVARRPVFTQPYYYFRPRTTLSFGFRIGFGVAYPWTYWDPYGFYNYGFAVGPGHDRRYYYGRVGGVSIDVQPWGASVYVDGRYVGVAADFGPHQMPLTLSAGRHRVEFRCDGYRTQKFDVHVIAGQVIPLQGDLGYR